MQRANQATKGKSREITNEDGSEGESATESSSISANSSDEDAVEETIETIEPTEVKKSAGKSSNVDEEIEASEPPEAQKSPGKSDSVAETIKTSKPIGIKKSPKKNKKKFKPWDDTGKEVDLVEVFGVYSRTTETLAAEEEALWMAGQVAKMKVGHVEDEGRNSATDDSSWTCEEDDNELYMAAQLLQLETAEEEIFEEELDSVERLAQDRVKTPGDVSLKYSEGTRITTDIVSREGVEGSTSFKNSKSKLNKRMGLGRSESVYEMYSPASKSRSWQSSLATEKGDKLIPTAPNL